MKIVHTAALAALAALSALPAGAQALIHRYSFNGNANDSVGTAPGVVVGSVSFLTSPSVNGAAVFAGGTTSSSPGFISLPVSTISGLQNATVEIFTTNFTIPVDQTGQPGGYFQALLSVATPATNLTNYLILSPNRSGAGIGTGARINSGTEQVVVSHDPLPAGVANHVVDLVYSGFTGIGSTGTETIYLDGTQVAQGQTVFSFADVASGAGGLSVVGIGGGSPFNDPTLNGSLNEVRIFSSALTPAQVVADVATGPSVLGFVPTPVITTLSTASASGFVGQSVSLNATLTRHSDGAALSGKTVSFQIDGGAAVGTAITNAQGSASLFYLVPSTTAAGSHSLTASFGGDTSYQASAGSGPLTLHYATQMAVASSAGTPGKPAILRATLTQLPSNAGVSQKTVTFTVDGQIVGSATTNSGGSVLLLYWIPLTAIRDSVHTVGVSFVGDSVYGGAAGTGNLTEK